jgi:SAM-dependent methyltransferase
MWNVLEHLEAPIQSIRCVHRLLKENGWFIFSIPNLESLDAHLFGPYWMGWDVPRHLYLFPQAKLRAILDENGFRWETAHCLSTSYAALGDSLTFWMQSWSKRLTSAGRVMMRFYRTPLARAGLVLPLWVLDRFNRSSILTVFAQKKP